MLFYVDESGPFARAADASCSISCVGVLCVPHGRADRLFAQYLKLRRGFPTTPTGEVKGRLLNEKQVATIIDLVRRSGCLFEVTACDHLEQLDAATHDHIVGQVHGMKSGLTDEHHPTLRADVNALCDRLLAMPHNLYRQLVAQNDAVDRMIRHVIVYFAMRQPSELSQFVWHVDAKGDENSGITEWEDWWQSTLGAIMQAKSVREPFATIVEGDYSYFDKNFDVLPEFLRPSKCETGIDIRAILMDQVHFNVSGTPGLELVDILTNTTRRALVGNLKPEGWSELGRLIIRQSKQHRIRMMAIGAIDVLRKGRPYLPVLKTIDRCGRSMFPTEKQ